MTPYADPRRCPNCGGALPETPSTCPTCAVTLTGPVAAELYRTLLHADALVTELRAMAPAPAVGTPGEATSPQPVPAQGTPASPESPGVRLSGASVPKILLTLGALCLLVAAVTFLAVAWAWLGVGGRTAVLVLFTAATGVLAWWLDRRGLRIAAEALSVVAFGLLALDLVGADDAGWLGDLSQSGLLAVVGLVIGIAGIAVTALRAGERRLVAPQVIAALGLCLVPLGLAGTTTHDELVFAVAVATLAGLALAARRLQAGLLPWLLAGAGATWWLPLAGLAVVRLVGHPSLRELWLEANAWPALVAAMFVAVGAWLLRDIPLAPQALGAVAAVAVSATLAAPVVDESATRAVFVLLPMTVAWAVAMLALDRRWRAVAAAPALVLFLAPAATALAVTDQVMVSLTGVSDVWDTGIGTTVPVPDLVATPLAPVLAAVVAALLAVGLAALFSDRPLDLAREYVGPLGGFVAAAGIVTVAAYGGPLATVPVGLAAVTLALVGLPTDATDRAQALSAALAAGTAMLALSAAAPSVGLTLLALTAVAAAGAWLASRRPMVALRVAASAVAVLALGGIAWTLGELTEVDEPWRGVLVIVAVGGLALALPRPEWEAPAAVAGLVAVATSVGIGADRVPTEALAPLALMLTVAGALVTTTSLLHASRRLAAWPGGLLLAMATWVRLYDLGIETPELYTLPSALALCLVGLHRMRLDPGAATLTALAPGLTLATLPSLIRVFVEDPISPRALLLGLACLGLVLAGARLRWTAPIAVGGAVGAVLVLRELGPYAAQLPPWMVIALAGTALTVVGVTWESRMREVRGAARYLGQLR